MRAAGNKIAVALAMTKHLRVFAIATLFGLGAYAVVWALILVSRRIGLLAWLAG